MISESSLIEHERTFDNIVQSLATMKRIIESSSDLVLIYANSLLQKEYET